jgi:hypothetical protein
VGYSNVHRGWVAVRGCIPTSTTPISTGSVESLTPLERWRQETAKEAPWNDVGGVATSPQTGSNEVVGKEETNGGSTDVRI